ncbi:MAG: hypothetical protein D6740_13060 [Alphaproteobacteria bacterium]|nr:MAG: hypothetical protein D6740_13060 [Alphaproteobacteria bacterium]
MPLSLLILDDFLVNVDEIRRIGLQQQYPRPEAPTYFPGRNSAGRLNIAGLEEEISRILGVPVEAAAGTGHGRFRLTLAGDEGLGDVHIDECFWSGILYLSRPEDCRGGTVFFRHKASGMDHAPLSRDELARFGVKSFEDFWDRVLVPQSKDRSAWEEIMTVPMRYNRLVLFRPWFFHTAGPGFGDRPENGRLVFLMFFQEKGSRTTR